MNIARWVSRNARAFPRHRALARGEAVHGDWASFAGRASAIAGALLGDLGCRPGDRAAVVMKNRCEYLEALFGIWHAGLVSVPVNAKLHPDEMAWILDHSGASVVFTDAGLAERGATNVVPASGGVDAAEIAALLGRWPGLSFFAAPTIVGRLLSEPAMRSAPIDHLKTIVYGGAPMYRADLDRALDCFGLRLAQIYGQGESPMTITALSKADHGLGEKLGTVGRPRTDVEVRVVGGDDDELPVGETGEVVVRGDVVMAGYWNDPAATAEAMRGGWLHTGDVGSFDGDGYLTLRDRSKDVIISGGSNIYPKEVEEVLLRHPGIREVSVVGTPHPEWGEEVVAFVVAGDPAAPPAPDELDRLCLENIARFKRPRRYLFLAELPKNNYGKVLKRELRAELSA